ncbi:transglutaminase-like domain-containing protein [Azospirillum sp. ST 5-10]|uniref:transglutaminase-like domain-containing protein n=1 Tax=unclassified Azospirillum TaxID=2630922 RepID=UPI003F4A79F9
MDTALRLHLAPAEYVDSDHPAVRAFARDVAGGAGTAEERARLLYTAVRDIRYDPYRDFADPATYRASGVLAAGTGYCVSKAALYAATARSVGIPARLGYADVRNHLSTRRLQESVGTDVFVWHGYVELRLGERWVKATPTFNASLCAKLGVAVLDFDGVADAMLQPADSGGRRFMEYLVDHGVFHDVPAKFLMGEMARLYPRLCRGGDMELEAEDERTRDGDAGRAGHPGAP